MVIYSNGQGSVILRVKLRSSAVATGAGLTGLTHSSAGLIIATIADTESATTRYRASSSEVETITTLGTYEAPTSGKCRFKEVDAANHPGLYEIHLADARLAVSNAKSAIVSLSGATNLVETDLQILLHKVNPYDAVRGGMTALPNANADAAGGLPISDAGGLDLDARLDAAVSSRLAAASYTAPLDAAGTRSAVGLSLANLETLLSSMSSSLSTVSGYIDTEVAAIKAKTDNLPSDPADASDVAASFSALASTLATVAGYIDTEIGAIKAKTDNLPASPASVSDIPTAAQNADGLLARAIAGGANGGRTVSEAFKAQRNRVEFKDDGTFDVYEADDTTVAYSGAYTRAAKDAVVAINPA